MEWAVELVELRKRPLLRGISFAAPAGAITAVTGGPDATRALLFRLVAGLELPERGAVLVLGDDISRARRRAKPRAGVVFAGPDFALFSGQTVRENVGVDALLNRCGLVAVADELPDALPLALRRRTALARALAQRAPLVLIDAFDAGLDAREAGLLVELLRGSSALLMVADRALAAQVADVVIDLDELAGYDMTGSLRELMAQ
jgi:ABC-type transporter Mla maintaining outer membrane lipid asymmetry ATPase subunit MlaF